MSAFRSVCRPALIAVAGVAILLSGCGQGASQSEGAQAKKDATQLQAQKDMIKQQQDTQASLTADVKKLKDDAAKAAEAKTVATNAAKAAAARAAAAMASITFCSEAVSAGPNTTCTFAKNVSEGLADALFDGRTGSFDVYSPTTGVSSRMTCAKRLDSTNSTMVKSAVTFVCRGGKDAVVYIAGSNPPTGS
jgi:hypothetical protein